MVPHIAPILSAVFTAYNDRKDADLTHERHMLQLKAKIVEDERRIKAREGDLDV